MWENKAVKKMWRQVGNALEKTKVVILMPRGRGGRYGPNGWLKKQVVPEGRTQ
jgi:hypothetical protein